MFEMFHRAKFWRYRLNRGRDMAIFRFFKMAAAAILDFWKLKFLTVGTLKRVKLRLHAKFWQNRSNRGWGMTIFRFWRWRPPPSWICNACVGTTHEGHLVFFITVQNLVGIDTVVVIICTFFDFASLAWKRLFNLVKIDEEMRPWECPQTDTHTHARTDRCKTILLSVPCYML